MAEWLRSGRRKARKEHKCDLCGLPIEKGTSYFHGTYVDVEIDELRMHPWCQREIDWYYKAYDLYDDDGYAEYEVHDFVHEQIRDYGYEERGKDDAA